MGEKEPFIILGATSFSAIHFIDYLLRHNHSVIGISRSPMPHKLFIPADLLDHPKYQFHQLDINNQLDQIMDIIQQEQAPYVVNFAAQGMVSQSWDNPEHWYMTNTVSTIKCHDRLRHFTFLKKYVHISTPEVYGNCTGIIKEHTHYEPSTPYAISKAAADMSLMSFHRAYSFPVVFTRAANIYGEHQQLYRIIPRTIIYFLLNKPLFLHGGGTSIRSFIHIKDVTEGTYQATLKGASGDIFHLSRPDRLSIRKLVEKIAQKLNVSFQKHVTLVDERLGKDQAYLLDTTKAETELNWAPSIELDQGIDRTIQWVETHLDTIKSHPLDYIHKE